jgi:hypothetical protein
MKVIQSISYDDGQGHKLTVPPGFLTDGASIPRALWSILGSPFSGGNYVEAAVIHDEGCDSRIYSWQITHLMFFMAMLDSGVSEHYAKLLYYGVRLGGPRWAAPVIDPKTGSLIPGPYYATRGLISDEDLKNFDNELTNREAKGHPISIGEIDGMTDSQ